MGLGSQLSSCELMEELHAPDSHNVGSVDCSWEASLEYYGVVHVCMHLCVSHIVYSDAPVVYQY